MKTDHTHNTTNPWIPTRPDGRPDEPRLLFGRMYEDCAIEQSLFTPGDRVLCIGSAGCTAIALANAGCHVTAVDVNPKQTQYLRNRLKGAPPQDGSAGLLLKKIRSAIRLTGITPVAIRRFLELDNTDQQKQTWRHWVHNGPLGLILSATGSRGFLRLTYAKRFLADTPHTLGQLILDRLETGFSRHPNRNNPYAWQLLAGRPCPYDQPRNSPVKNPSIGVICAEITRFLSHRSPAAYDGFTLSNILDGAPKALAENLWSAVHRTAAPGATVVLRSFANPATPHETNWADIDRSMIWGSVQVKRVNNQSNHPIDQPQKPKYTETP